MFIGIAFHRANTTKIIIIFINYLIKTPFKYFNCKINPFSGIFINNKLCNHGIYGSCGF
jgi:hypothetical protein